MPAQVFGSGATATQLYLAFNGVAPSNPIYTNWKNVIDTQGESALALQIGQATANMSSASLAASVLANLGVSAATTNAEAFAALSAAVVQLFDAYPASSRGQIVLNMTKLLVGLEGNATYGTAAANFNNTTLSAYTYASNPASTSPGSTTQPTGSFTFTTAIDVLNGSAGDDTFIGDASTLSNADQVSGGTGTDTLKMYGTAGAADIPAMSSIEAVLLSGATASHDFSSHAGLTSLSLDDATTGFIFTVGSGVTSLAAANMANGENVEFKVASTATAANVTVNALGTATGGGVTLKLDGAALTTLNLTATGATSKVLVANGTAAITDTLTTVNVSGDKAATVDLDTTAFTLVTAVNASANTGGVTAILEDGTGANVTVTGGSGNDTANFGDKFTKGDKFNGGEGTDTLQMTQASVTVVQGYAAADKLVVNDNLTSVEVLKVTDALTGDIDATRFDAINSYVFAAGINPAATSTLSAVTSGVTVELNADAGTATDVLAVEITDATLAGNNSDTITLKLIDRVDAAANATDYGVLNAVGVDVLNITSSKSSSSLATSNNIEIAATSSALDKVVVSGDLALTLTDVALVNSIAEVDASGLVLSATTATGLAVSIATGGTNGVKITGSNGVDTLTGGDAADIILAGSGNDIVIGGKGNDVLTGGAGNDTFRFAAGDSSVTATLFDSITDYSNTTTVGTTDTIDFTSANGVVGTTALAGFTLNTGVATKSGATLADFITAVNAAGTANETYAFVVGSDTYVYNAGANGVTDTTDNVLIKLVGVVGAAVVTADTTVANEILIA